MIPARRRTLVVAAVLAALVLDARAVLPLAPPAGTEPVLRPRRADERSSSLQWMPDVAERLRLLGEHGCRRARRQHGAASASSPLDDSTGPCRIPEQLP